MTESPLSPSSPVIKATSPPYPVKPWLAPDRSWSDIDETAGPSRKRRCACRGTALASVSAATSKTVLGMDDWYTRRGARGRDVGHGLTPLVGCTNRSEEHTSELQSRSDLGCR